MKATLTGKCLCGAVTYAAQGKPVVVAQCHCDECRRLSGTGHTIGAMYPVASVSISGPTAQFQYASSKESVVTRVFCPSCGSPILGKNTRSPEHLTLSLGTMDDAESLKVEVVIFDRDKQHWDQITDGIPRFATMPDWSPPK